MRLLPRVLRLACVRVLLGRVPVLVFVLLLFDPPPTGENNRRISPPTVASAASRHTPHIPPFLPPRGQCLAFSSPLEKWAKRGQTATTRMRAWRNVHGDRDIEQKYYVAIFHLDYILYCCVMMPTLPTFSYLPPTTLNT